MMYEKLDKLRTDLKRARQKKMEIEAKIRNLEQKLQEAEDAQILADVKHMNLTPEQLAQFLQLAAAGKLPIPSREEVEENAETSVDPEQAEEQEDAEDEEEQIF